MRDHDPAHPPKNRRPESLDILVIEVEHAHGIERTDPNGAAATAYVGATGADLAGDLGQGAPRLTVIRLADLEPVPGAASVLSGAPALIYRSDDLEIPLTADELHRLLDHSLRPDEFLALRERYGDAYPWHADFYHPRTGKARQPVTGKPLKRR